MTPAERLTAAAVLLEKRAGEATKGPWGSTRRSVWCEAEDVDCDADPIARGSGVGDSTPANMAYIATMHPEVGKALVLLLRDEARRAASSVLPVARSLALADLLLAGES